MLSNPGLRELEVSPLGCRLIDMPVIEDARGRLAVFESPTHVPFDVARVFIISDVPVGQRRGGHANRDLDELLVAVQGSVEVTLRSPDRQIVLRLDDPSRGLHIPPMTWLEMGQFAVGTVLVVMASLPYDADCHIEDFAEYCDLYRRTHGADDYE